MIVSEHILLILSKGRTALKPARLHHAALIEVATDRFSRKHNSLVAANLEEIKRSQQSLEIKFDAKMDLIREDVIRKATAARSPDTISQAAQLTILKTKLDLLEKRHVQCTAQIKLLKSLYIPELRKRWVQIPRAHVRSNNWIFDRELTSFHTWLESEANGDGLFCITGKVKHPRQKA